MADGPWLPSIFHFRLIDEVVFLLTRSAMKKNPQKWMGLIPNVPVTLLYLPHQEIWLWSMDC